MTRLKLIAIVAAAFVVGGGAAVGLGALGAGEPERASTASATPEERRSPPDPASPVAPPRGRASPAASGSRRATPERAGCANLRLSAAERAALERRAFGAVAARGTVYFGVCDGRHWSMARLEGGGDGVYVDVRSSHPVRIGSIAAARCRVPRALLAHWRRADGCGGAAADPPAGPAEAPPPTTTQPAPGPERPSPQPDGQRRYPNGRTYIEQVNFCNLMRDQGVPCTVPPPP